MGAAVLAWCAGLTIWAILTDEWGTAIGLLAVMGVAIAVVARIVA